MKFLLLDVQGSSAIHSIKKVSVLSAPFSPPLGLLYIGKALEEDGHKVELLQSIAETSFEETLKKSLKSIDAVGLCVNTKFYSYAAHVAKIIKEYDASIPIIIGGPHCTFHPKSSLLDIPYADISVEGDFVLPL